MSCLHCMLEHADLSSAKLAAVIKLCMQVQGSAQSVSDLNCLSLACLDAAAAAALIAPSHEAATQAGQTLTDIYSGTDPMDPPFLEAYASGSAYNVAMQDLRKRAPMPNTALDHPFAKATVTRPLGAPGALPATADMEAMYRKCEAIMASHGNVKVREAEVMASAMAAKEQKSAGDAHSSAAPRGQAAAAQEAAKCEPEGVPATEFPAGRDECAGAADGMVPTISFDGFMNMLEHLQRINPQAHAELTKSMQETKAQQAAARKRQHLRATSTADAGQAKGSQSQNRSPAPQQQAAQRDKAAPESAHVAGADVEGDDAESGASVAESEQDAAEPPPGSWVHLMP